LLEKFTVQFNAELTGNWCGTRLWAKPMFSVRVKCPCTAFG